MTLQIIGGKYKGRRLSSPKHDSTRPTQGMLREAVFNICQLEIVGAHLLDLYAGSGAMGLEALSRGAAHVTFVEKKRDAILCIKKNIESLGVKEASTLLARDAMEALMQCKEPFDLIYIDPPYDLSTRAILEKIASSHLLKTEGTLFLEERFDPHKKANPFQPDGLQLKKSRKFGIALLHQYRAT